MAFLHVGDEFGRRHVIVLSEASHHARDLRCICRPFMRGGVVKHRRLIQRIDGHGRGPIYRPWEKGGH